MDLIELYSYVHKVMEYGRSIDIAKQIMKEKGGTFSEFAQVQGLEIEYIRMRKQMEKVVISSIRGKQMEVV